MEEHKHCKLCKATLIEPKTNGVVEYVVNHRYLTESLYYKWQVCKNCVTKEGIRSLKEKGTIKEK